MCCGLSALAPWPGPPGLASSPPQSTSFDSGETKCVGSLASVAASNSGSIASFCLPESYNHGSSSASSWTTLQWSRCSRTTFFQNDDADSEGASWCLQAQSWNRKSDACRCHGHAAWRFVSRRSRSRSSCGCTSTCFCGTRCNSCVARVLRNCGSSPPSCSSAAWQLFRVPRGCGPLTPSRDSLTKGSNDGGGRGNDVD